MSVTNSFSILKNINAGTETCTIKVKVIRLWKQHYSNNPGVVASIEMILMDEECTKIQASIKRNLIDKFEMLFEEGNVKVISNFGLAENSGRFLLTPHPCKINFYRHTSVTNCLDFPVDTKDFSFMSFKDILSKNLNPIYAFDVIGELINCEDTKILGTKKGVDRRIKSLELRDIDGVNIKCCLWDDHVNHLVSFLNDPSNNGTRVILIIQNAKLGEWANKPQVSNSMFGSKLWINDQIPEIVSFKNRLLATQNVVVDSGRHLSTNTIVTNPEDYWNKLAFYKIDELGDISEPTTCVVIATIITIQGEQGWYYVACGKCGKKVQRSVDVMEDVASDLTPAATFDCDECGVITDVYHRLKIQLRVQDDTGSTSFVLFERDVTAFLDKPASVLLKKKKKFDEFGNYPDDFESFINKKCATSVGVSDYNLKNNYRVYTVNKLTDDVGIIHAVLKDANIEDNVSEDDVQCLTTPQSGAQSSKDAMSVTGDNDTPNDFFKSTASSPGSKKRGGSDTDDLLHVSMKTSRPNFKDVKIPKLEKF